MCNCFYINFNISVGWKATSSRQSEYVDPYNDWPSSYKMNFNFPALWRLDYMESFRFLLKDRGTFSCGYITINRRFCRHGWLIQRRHISYSWCFYMLCLRWKFLSWIDLEGEQIRNIYQWSAKQVLSIISVYLK